MKTSASGMLQPRRGRGVALAFALFLLAGLPLAAQVSREYDLKAAFLYNFATFVEWPAEAFADADSPLVIGVMGRDPFGTALDQIVAGEHIGTRKLVVHRFNRLEEMHHCHILFICSSEVRQIREILRQLKGQPVLTVADMPGFAEAGGDIGFATEERVTLIINPEAVQAANLTVSSKLLRLARLVREGASLP